MRVIWLILLAFAVGCGDDEAATALKKIEDEEHRRKATERIAGFRSLADYETRLAELQSQIKDIARGKMNRDALPRLQYEAELIQEKLASFAKGRELAKKALEDLDRLDKQINAKE